jgi:hypothetical protein
MAKKIIIAVVAVVIVIGVGLYFLYSNIGPIIKAAIEKYGSEATQSQVSVKSVTLSASSGQGTITGVIVDNPKGFTAPRAFELGSIALTVDTGTITRNPIEIKSVEIQAPRVTYEQGTSGNNLQTLQKNVQQYAGGSPSARTPSGGSKPPTGNAASPSPASTSAAQPERKLIIDRLDVVNGEVTVTATLLQGRTLKTKLPDIHLTDIGKKEGGATPAQVAQLVVAAISEQAAKAGAAELQKSLGNIGGAAQEQLQKVAPGVGDQLKGLLGK